jgi:hypothetical protein
LITLISGVSFHFGFYGAAAAVFILLFTGIHNAWDAVTWQVFQKPGDESEQPVSDRSQPAGSEAES